MNKELFYRIKGALFTGRFGLFFKRFLFVNFAVFIGLYIGIEFFFPDDFVLSKINNALFIKDMGLVAEDVEISMLGNISFEEGAFLEKGTKIITFNELSFSPSVLGLMAGELSGDAAMYDINNQGGNLEISFETSKTPCYSMSSQDVPLTLFKPFLDEVSFTGSMSGEGTTCFDEKKKIDGDIELLIEDTVFRGKIPTPMGSFDVGRIDLGNIEIKAKLQEGKAEVEKMIIDGIFKLDIIGKITLNTKAFASSRLDLDVRVEIPDMKKVQENPALNLLIGQMSQYKTGDGDKYAFMLRGFASKPQMSSAPKERTATEGSNKNRKVKKSRPERKRPSRKALQEKRKKTIMKPEETPKPALPLNKPEKNEEPEIKEEKEEKESVKDAPENAEKVEKEPEKLPADNSEDEEADDEPEKNRSETGKKKKEEVSNDEEVSDEE